ncbi:MAG: hypothetical protein LBU84_12300 [Prevotella sp.]|jgi:hypothetical protein|nr:hypothetical protein [Prevotella sp.]
MENTIDSNSDDTLDLEFLIDFFKSNIAPLTIYAYAIGIIYTLFYYFNWRIDITEYLNISETLLIPIKYLIFIFSMSGLMIIVFGSFHKLFKAYKDLFSKLQSFNVNYISLTIMFILAMFISILMDIVGYNGSLNFADMGAFIFYIFSISLILINKRKSIFKIIIKYLSVLTLIIILMKAGQDYYNSKKFSNKTQFLSFQYYDNNYIENDSIFSIGQTADFIFMYDATKKDCYIFERSQIHSIKLSPKKRNKN